VEAASRTAEQGEGAAVEHARNGTGAEPVQFSRTISFSSFRIRAICFPITGIDSGGGRAGQGEREGNALETPGTEPERRGFFYLNPSQPFEKSRFGKQKKANESNFAFI
jgi:hypothetical protein